MVKMSYKNGKILAEIVADGEERMKNLLRKMEEEEQQQERLKAIVEQQKKKSQLLEKAAEEEALRNFEQEFSSGCNGTDYGSDFETPTVKKKKLCDSTKICLQLSLNDVLDKWIPFMTR